MRKEEERKKARGIDRDIETERQIGRTRKCERERDRRLEKETQINRANKIQI